MLAANGLTCNGKDFMTPFYLHLTLLCMQTLMSVQLILMDVHSHVQTLLVAISAVVVQDIH